MVSASLLKTSRVIDKSDFVKGQTRGLPSVSVAAVPCSPSSLSVRAASSYADELLRPRKPFASPGRGILAMDEFECHLWETIGINWAREH
ncbi:Fructose-bisphosphate aldolase chloroplastic [Bienertia sinuspersici]